MKVAAARRRPLRKRSGQYHHRDLRRAMVEAAIRLIAEKGSEGFTLRELGERHGRAAATTGD
jgi:AcrR family transcriptional regulator